MPSKEVESFIFGSSWEGGWALPHVLVISLTFLIFDAVGEYLTFLILKYISFPPRGEDEYLNFLLPFFLLPEGGGVHYVFNDLC